MGVLFTVRGATDGSSTTGTFSLSGDLLQTAVSYIRIPKGMKLKVWCKRISGEPVEVIMEYTHDVTAASPTWVEVGREVLASAGELALEKRRPIVLRGFTGKEAFRAKWSQATAALSYAEFEVELE